MRYGFYFVLFFFFSLNSFAQNINIEDDETNFLITSNILTEFSFINTVSDINTSVLKLPQGDFLRLSMPNYVSNSKDGDAELPVLHDLVMVPLGSDIAVKIINKEEKIINLDDYGYDIDIFPHQPSISKGDDVSKIPFYYNSEYYNINEFLGEDCIQIKILGKMRGQQLARLSISPILYNPITNQLKVITSIEAKIVFKQTNISGDILNRKKYYSSEFESLFKSCVNYLPISGKDVITTYPVKYVIISDPAFQSALQPLVEWKTKKGFLVVEGYTNDPLVGNTTSSIKSFIKDMYDNATSSDPAPTYLLIVGDVAQVPSFNGNSGSHISDMYYCEFDGGGDFYPEMYYGRFSASNSGHVEVQVEKTLTYEQYTFTDPSFLDEVVLVAGTDASFATTHGNPQINYGTDYYFNSAHNLNVHTYLYGLIAPGATYSSDMPGASAAIISDISDGAGFANYTAHCGTSGWSDPSFETSDISGLQNINQYGLLIGNCCQSNKFDVNVCFGEALLRADDKGAVGYIGGSNNTYWDEDYWWAVGNGTTPPPTNPNYSGTGLGVYDSWVHENGEAQSDWFITQGQMIHSGNLAVTQAGAQFEEYYWEIYHLMGDPSLMPYLGVPPSLSVSHAASTPIGTSSFTVTTEENAYVALSMNGILLDAQLAGPSGIVNLSFSSLTNVGNADIVVTKQFRKPYISTVSIISANAPFVTYNTHNVYDPSGNNNTLIDYDELIELDVELINLGSQSTQNVDIIVSTNDPYITLIDSTDFLATVSASNTIMISSPFTFQVANYVPDQHVAQFLFTISDDQGNVWTSPLSLTINAPILSDLGFLIDDALGNANGKLESGETVDIIIEVENIGNADIDNLNAFLSCSSPYVTINTAFSAVPSLIVNQQLDIIFSITTDVNTPFGTPVVFAFDLTDGVYTHVNTFNTIIGIIDEDYETGDFTQYSWNQGVFPWVISNGNPYDGTNCARSAFNLPHSQESELSIDVNVLAPGDISFYKKVSSEQDFDFLKFKINGQKVGEWSGIDSDWSMVSFPVNSTGPTTFKWEYDKDGGWQAGDDCAYVDYIVFPPIYLESNPTYIQQDGVGNISLFPNPTMGSFRIDFSEKKLHIVQILDVHGALVETKQSEGSIDFDIFNKASGIYTVKILPENIVYKIIKH